MTSFRPHIFIQLILLNMLFMLGACVPSTVQTTKVNDGSMATSGTGGGLPDFFYASSTNIYTINVPFVLNPTITYGGQNLTFAIYGTLPTGLSFNTSTGAITGTPTSAPGSTSYTVVATNSAGTTTEEIVLVTGPVFSYSATNYDYVLNNTFTSQTPTITYPSSGAILFSISPALPAGMTFNTATGQISGTPTAASGATTFTITASANGASRSMTLGLFQAGTPVVSWSATANYVRNTAYTLTPSITYSGTSFNVIVQSGTLPTGLSLNASTGAISGTPTGTGNATVVLRYSNLYGSNIQTINFVEVGPPIFSTVTYTPSFQRGVAFTLDLEAALTFPSAASVSYTSSPALPNANCSLSLNTSTGVISGTIATNATTTASDCARSYTITATNNADPLSRTRLISVTLSETGPPQFEYPFPALTYTYNTAFSATPSVYYAGPGIAFTVDSGSLPPGVSLNASTGVISGTPTSSVNSDGSIHQVVIKATNSSSNASFTLDFSEEGPIRLSYSKTDLLYYRQGGVDSPAATATVSFCKGGCSFAFAANPSLPPELVINPISGNITINTINTKRTATFYVVATDANDESQTTAFTIDEGCWANGGDLGTEKLGTQAFGGGAGTDSDPWLLCSDNHINEMSTDPHHMLEYFVMKSDIQMKTKSEPIGGAISTCFQGGFDGDNYLIHDFKVYDSLSTFPHNGYFGPSSFFYCLSDFDYVKNLTLTNLFILTSNGVAAGLAAKALPSPLMSSKSSEISNVSIYGAFIGNNTTGPGPRLTAGLIAKVDGVAGVHKPLILRYNIFHGTIYQRSSISYTASGLVNVADLSNTTLKPTKNIAFLDPTTSEASNFPNPDTYHNFVDFNDLTTPGNSPTFSYNYVVNLKDPAPPFPQYGPDTISLEGNDAHVYDFGGFWDPEGFSDFKPTEKESGARALVPAHLCQRSKDHIIFRPAAPEPWIYGEGLGLICQ